MPQDTTLPVAVGGYLTAPVATGVLGQVYHGLNGQKYRWVLSGEALLPNAVVVTAYSTTTANLGRPSWSVKTTVIANDPNVCGVVPPEYTAGVPNASYFLVQISGYCTPNFAVTSLTNTSLGNGLLATATIGGCAAPFTAVTDPAVVVAAAFGLASNTAGTSSASLSTSSTTMVAGRALLLKLFDKFSD